MLQLVWTQVHKYPEAYATQSANILRLLAPYTPPKSSARRLPFEMNVICSLYLGVVAIMATEQPQFVLRDMILSLLEGSDTYTTVDAFPTGRVTLAILALLVLGSGEKSVFPTCLIMDIEISSLCDSFIHYKPDMITSESLEKVKVMIGKAFVTLDSLIYDSTSVYDPTIKTSGTIGSSASRAYHSHTTSGDYSPQECTPLSTLHLIMAVAPVINLKMGSPLQQLQLLLQYVAHPDSALATTALKSFQATLSASLIACPDSSFLSQLYTIYSKQVDKVPDRHLSCLTRMASLLPLIVIPLLQTIDEDANEGDILMDIASKILLFSLSISDVVVSDVREKICTLQHPILDPFLRVIERQAQLGRRGMIFELHSNCLDFCQQAKVVIMSRMQEIQSLIISGRLATEEDSLVNQWGSYLEFLFRFGPPDVDVGSVSQRRADTSKLLRYLTFSRSDGGSPSGSRRELFNFLRSTIQQVMLIENNESTCSKLIDSVRAINPAFICDTFDALEGLLGSVSKDLRNVEYQFVRKNRKQDMLKIDLTRLLASIVSAMQRVPGSSASDPNSGLHRTIQRYIVEIFYFCSEIDTDEFLPSLRTALATLIQEYHEIVSGRPNRYDFFPFKLQTELFTVIRKWYDQRRLGHAKEQGGKGGSLESVTDVNAPTTPMVSPGNAEEILAKCLGSLCRGLLSPLPIYRQESIPSSQVLRWIDSLIGKSWGPPLIKEAVRNLLLSCGGAILEKVVQKIFQADMVAHYPELSNSYFIALGETILLTQGDVPKISLPHKTIISMVTLIHFRGSVEAQSVAKRLVVTVLRGIDGLELAGSEEQNNPLNVINLEYELERVLPDRYAAAAGEVVAEMSMRMEYLLLSPSSLRGSILPLMVNWLHKVILLPGKDQSSLLLNLCLLTLRLEQAGYGVHILWEALVTLWRGNMLGILQIWMDLIFGYRKASLLQCSRQLVRHLGLEHGSTLCDCLVLMTDARQSLTPPLFQTTGYVPYIARDIQGTGQIVTRLEGFLQTSDKALIDEQLTVGYVLLLWLAEIRPRMPLHPVLDHLSWLVGISDEDQSGYGFPVGRGGLVTVEAQVNNADYNTCNGSFTDMEELLWVILSWATDCPIREFSLRSWQRFAELVPGLCLPAEQLHQIILIGASFLRRVAFAGSSGPSTVLAVQDAVAELSNVTLLSLASLRLPLDDSSGVGEALGRLCLLMTSCDLVATYGAALSALGILIGRLPMGRGASSSLPMSRTVPISTGMLEDRSSCTIIPTGKSLDQLSPEDLAMVMRGYGDETTCALTTALLCHLVHRQYRMAETEGETEGPLTELDPRISLERMIPLLAALIPSLLREAALQAGEKMLIETLSMLCNMFEASLTKKSTLAPAIISEYRLVIRILQSWGRRKRTPADSARDLAMLLNGGGATGSESLLAPYTSILVIGVLCRLRATTRDSMTRGEFHCIVVFLETWLSSSRHELESHEIGSGPKDKVQLGDKEKNQQQQQQPSPLWMTLLEAIIAALNHDTGLDEQAVHRLLAILTSQQSIVLPSLQPVNLSCPLPFAIGHNIIAKVLSSGFIEISQGGGGDNDVQQEIRVTTMGAPSVVISDLLA